MSPSPAAASAAIADARPEVLWLDSAERPAPGNALCGGATTDLVIVGAGFTGLWAAIQAKEDDPSRSVTVIEAGRVADQASGRNGGFCSSSLTHGSRTARRGSRARCSASSHSRPTTSPRSRPRSSATPSTATGSRREA